MQTERYHILARRWALHATVRNLLCGAIRQSEVGTTFERFPVFVGLTPDHHGHGGLSRHTLCARTPAQQRSESAFTGRHASLDQLISAGKQRWRHRQTECLSR